MDAFANRPPRDRADVFLASAERRGIEHASIIEKDFWVCWTLARIFANRDMPNGRADIIFKGGTSLSKVYAAIERFSEDIDLTVNRQLLGFAGSAGDPAAQLSKTKATALLKQISEAGGHYVNGPFLAKLRQRIAAALAVDATTWSIEPDAADAATLIFHYPRSLAREEYDNYVSPSIRLECGARGEIWPASSKTIHAYAAEDFPTLFSATDITVDVLDAERTFWEKATLLHEIAHRAGTIPHVLPTSRLSRHYYDLARLADQSIGTRALTRIDLLRAVAQHKATFFPRRTAQFELAVPGTLKLTPPLAVLAVLRTDYNNMRSMFFSDPPTFDDIMDRLHHLESTINAASGSLTRAHRGLP